MQLWLVHVCSIMFCRHRQITFCLLNALDAPCKAAPADVKFLGYGRWNGVISAGPQNVAASFRSCIWFMLLGEIPIRFSVFCAGEANLMFLPAGAYCDYCKECQPIKENCLRTPIWTGWCPWTSSLCLCSSLFHFYFYVLLPCCLSPWLATVSYFYMVDCQEKFTCACTENNWTKSSRKLQCPVLI